MADHQHRSSSLDADVSGSVKTPEPFSVKLNSSRITSGSVPGAGTSQQSNINNARPSLNMMLTSGSSNSPATNTPPSSTSPSRLPLSSLNAVMIRAGDKGLGGSSPSSSSGMISAGTSVNNTSPRRYSAAVQGGGGANAGGFSPRSPYNISNSSHPYSPNNISSGGGGGSGGSSGGGAQSPMLNIPINYKSTSIPDSSSDLHISLDSLVQTRKSTLTSDSLFSPVSFRSRAESGGVSGGTPPQVIASNSSTGRLQTSRSFGKIDENSDYNVISNESIDRSQRKTSGGVGSGHLVNSLVSSPSSLVQFPTTPSPSSYNHRQTVSGTIAISPSAVRSQVAGRTVAARNYSNSFSSPNASLQDLSAAAYNVSGRYSSLSSVGSASGNMQAASKPNVPQPLSISSSRIQQQSSQPSSPKEHLANITPMSPDSPTNSSAGSSSVTGSNRGHSFSDPPRKASSSSFATGLNSSNGSLTQRAFSPLLTRNSPLKAEFVNSVSSSRNNNINMALPSETSSLTSCRNSLRERVVPGTNHMSVASSISEPQNQSAHHSLPGLSNEEDTIESMTYIDGSGGNDGFDINQVLVQQLIQMKHQADMGLRYLLDSYDEAYTDTGKLGGGYKIPSRKAPAVVFGVGVSEKEMKNDTRDRDMRKTVAAIQPSSVHISDDGFFVGNDAETVVRKKRMSHDFNCRQDILGSVSSIEDTPHNHHHHHHHDQTAPISPEMCSSKNELLKFQDSATQRPHGKSPLLHSNSWPPSIFGKRH